MTSESTKWWNRFAAARADEVLFAYATPGGKTERLCHEVIGRGETAPTLDSVSSTLAAQHVSSAERILA